MKEHNTIPENALEMITVALKPYRPDLSRDAISKALDTAGTPDPIEAAAPPRPAMTRAEAATALGVSIFTISNYIKQGYLRAVKIGKGNRLVRIDPTSIETMLGRSTATNTATNA